MTVHVCPTKDIECGDRPGNWCSECPKHQQAINWKDPDTRESAMAAKWAEAEDKVRVLREALQDAVDRLDGTKGGSVSETLQMMRDALEATQ